MPWVVVVRFAPLAAGRNLSEDTVGGLACGYNPPRTPGADAWTSLVPAVITLTVRPSDIYI